MANYQSTHTGAEIDAGIDLLDKNSATNGQVLTANGTGGATWQDPSGGSGGGTQLYMHTIHLESNNTDTFITLYSSISQQFTFETLRDYLGEDPICLAGFDSTLPENVINLYYDSVTNTIRLTYIGSQGDMTHRNFPSDGAIYDTVKQL